MKRREKDQLRPRIVPLGPESLSGEKGQSAAKLDSKRSTNITKSTFIKAPVERCFELVAKQLEETPDWDPTIQWVNPISIKHVRVGSMSRVTFKLGGETEEAVAVVRSCSPNRAILWTSTHSTQLQEEWEFQKEPDCTIVTVTLSYNPPGGLLGRLTDRIGMRHQVDEAVSQMLEKLKATAENRK
ncbi:MAG: SRPBCC family protein [Chloroflexi bacterium]|nr:SRPBCC family protein [Chloroflexota bacterium]